MRLSILILNVILISSCSSDDSDKHISHRHRNEKVKFLSITDTVYRFSPGSVEGSAEGIPFFVDSLAIHWPLISSPVNDPQMDSLLYQNFNYSSVMGETIDETFEEYAKTGTGITDIQYTISYNDKGVFSIVYRTGYTSAHLSYSHYFVNLDLFNYTSITLDSLVADNALEAFDSSLNKKVQEKLDSVRSGLTAEDSELLGHVFNRTWNSTDALGVTLDEDGINIYISYEFPQYAKMLEPEGYIKIGWTEMNEYLDLKSPVTRIIPVNS